MREISGSVEQCGTAVGRGVNFEFLAEIPRIDSFFSYLRKTRSGRLFRGDGRMRVRGRGGSYLNFQKNKASTAMKD